MLSTTGCRQALGSLLYDSGSPRYVQGNGLIMQGKCCTATAKCSSVQRMGEMEHFSKFVRRPLAPPKHSRTSLTTSRSCAHGVTKMTMSSAYTDVRNRTPRQGSGDSTPDVSAQRSATLRTSMTKRNNV